MPGVNQYTAGVNPSHCTPTPHVAAPPVCHIRACMCHVCQPWASKEGLATTLSTTTQHKPDWAACSLPCNTVLRHFRLAPTCRDQHVPAGAVGSLCLCPYGNASCVLAAAAGCVPVRVTLLPYIDCRQLVPPAWSQTSTGLPRVTSHASPTHAWSCFPTICTDAATQAR
jgi:hypothetical protein